ncbi:vanadium-dependent haloperoxidase [Amycolatopsis sp. FBCC-B4732]|uniref:vanadium-dependent haloperoxidase n=1 Tax=Amycolatopsis sp. FBCC-B4732 TaxID=3079339 RepID=UPI001FF286F5|nr:vanadium-dependent haloperoxidase [Amycolatopsis sp. FBCC-B4732]UOX85874.1 vanadium-dependent haloperoxidase [Amycolatopsis sp. FBCC-B4732]
MTTSMSRRNLLVASGAAAAALALPAPATASPARGGADVVLAWNRELLTIVRTPGLQPATVHATRGFALLHAAIHDAVVATTGTGRPYLFTVDAPPHAAPEAAAAQAAHDVLAALYPARSAELANLLSGQLARLTPAGRDAGARAGHLVARLLLGLRANDGSAAVPPVLPPGTAPGEYRPTPPAFAPAAFTHWAAVTPFVLDRANRFRPGAYPALSGAVYAKALREVAAAGRDTSTTRTDGETEQARFWAAPIWNYWNEIAQSVAGGSRTGLVVAARVFARLNLAFADAVIAFYEAKYHHRIWRPITAVRLAGDDGNPATRGIADWSSLATTPADPAYPGAHSVISQAGALILSQEYGPRRALAVTSEALPGVVRHFTTFQDVADEAGLSRLVAGVHTRLDHDAGRRLGQDVAAFVLRS